MENSDTISAYQVSNPTNLKVETTEENLRVARGMELASCAGKMVPFLKVSGKLTKEFKE